MNIPVFSNNEDLKKATGLSQMEWFDFLFKSRRGLTNALQTLKKDGVITPEQYTTAVENELKLYKEFNFLPEKY